MITPEYKVFCLSEAKRIGFEAAWESFNENILTIRYTKARRQHEMEFDFTGDNGEVATRRAWMYAELDRLYANRRRSRATADAYRSVGMVRTPYGWE